MFGIAFTLHGQIAIGTSWGTSSLGLLKNARVALGAAGEERRVLPKCAAVYPGFSESPGCSLSLLCLRTDTV